MSFWCGRKWQRWAERNRAEEHARWIARFWNEGMDLDAVAVAIAHHQHVNILRDDWAPATGDDLAHGPVVEGRTIWIRKDKSIRWETAR